VSTLRRTFKQWWFWYTPQSPGYDTRWLEGLKWRIFKVTSYYPLLSLMIPSWWRRTASDIRRGRCKRCGTCNRSWFSFHVLPAIVGQKFIPPCGR
jgi:hypothetical protein